MALSEVASGQHNVLDWKCTLRACTRPQLAAEAWNVFWFEIPGHLVKEGLNDDAPSARQNGVCA